MGLEGGGSRSNISRRSIEFDKSCFYDEWVHSPAVGSRSCSARFLQPICWSVSLLEVTFQLWREKDEGKSNSTVSYLFFLPCLVPVLLINSIEGIKALNIFTNPLSLCLKLSIPLTPGQMNSKGSEMEKIRPLTRLPKSHASGQGQWW